ncbi:MAG: hypothetical protein QG608_2410 [Actinomycetota bacterium]|nr:hypothetical protein [Actinomycetota bacterium]
MLGGQTGKCSCDPYRPEPSGPQGRDGEQPGERPGEPLVTVELEVHRDVQDPAIRVQHLPGGERQTTTDQVVVRRLTGMAYENPAEMMDGIRRCCRQVLHGQRSLHPLFDEVHRTHDRIVGGHVDRRAEGPAPGTSLRDRAGEGPGTVGRTGTRKSSSDSANRSRPRNLSS